MHRDILNLIVSGPIGTPLRVPGREVTLGGVERRAARVLLWLQETYPDASERELLETLEEAVWWSRLLTVLDPNSDGGFRRVATSEAAPGEPRVELRERTARMLDLVLQEHADERYDGSQLGLEVAVGLAAPRSHRHYPDGRPDCAACVFFGLVKGGAHG